MPTGREIVGVLSLEGNASEELEKFNSSADKSVTSLERVEGGTEQVEEATDKATQSTANFGLAMGALAGAAVTTALVGFAKESLAAFTELEKGRVVLQNMAGKDYPALQAAVNKAAGASLGGRAEGDLLAVANTMQKFGLSTQFTAKSMGFMQKMSDATGKELTSNIMQMSNAIGSGAVRFLQQNKVMSKYAEQFRKLGPGSDVLVKLKREQFLLNIMQKEGVNVNTQYNRIMDTNHGQMRKMDTEWGNVKERIGGVISKAILPLLKHLANMVQWLGSSEEAMVLMKPAVILLAVVIGVTMVAALVAAAVAAWAFVAPFIPIILIIAAVAVVIAALVYVGYELYEWFQGGDSIFTEWIGSFEAMWAGVKATVASVIEWIENAWKKIKPYIGAVASFMTGGTSDLVIGTANIAGGRASGGHVSPDSTYRVNERGQEYFSPGVQGSIIPAGGSGGSGISVSVAVSVVVQNISDIKEAVKDAIDSLSENEFAAEAGLEMEPAF